MRQYLVSLEQSALLNEQIASLDSVLQTAFPRQLPVTKSEARLPFWIVIDVRIETWWNPA